MGGGDFAKGFSFDIGGGDGQPAQAPWEFQGAIATAEKQQPGSLSTSIDHKIKQRVLNKRYVNLKQEDSSEDEEIDEAEEDAEEDDDDAEEDDDEDEDDEPLPGEVDDSDDEDEEVDGESDEEDEEEEMEEEGAAEMPEDVQSDEEEGGDDGDNDKEEEEDGDEEEEEEMSRKSSSKHASVSGAKDDDGGVRAAFFSAAPKGTSFSSASFTSLNLSRPLVKACAELGYARPTPIQAACIPVALAGRDVCGSAVTGSGKTAAFGLPLLERLMHRDRRVATTYVCVLTPTRELAVQVHSMIEKLAQFTDIRAVLVVGGLSLNMQAASLRTCPEIVVATPGRLIDHLRNSQSVHLEDLATLVLDEADRLLEMGFAEEVTEIVKMAPTKRQTLLFSATMTNEVKKLASLSLRKPVRLAADTVGLAPKLLRQEIIRLKGAQVAAKEAVLLSLCSRSFSGGRTIIFAKTKQRAHRIKILFGLAELPLAVELHGNMTQAQRLQSLEDFRKGKAAYLIATDVAARGLDILGVEGVVNFDCPRAISSYVHRVGRTARAGAKGLAVTLVEDSERKILKEIVKTTKAKLQSRIVAEAAVKKWHASVEAMESDYRRIMQEERIEKELRKAEMEADKANNIMDHEAEIMSRPKRTWFQTERQKRALAEAVKIGVMSEEAAAEAKPKNAKERKKEKIKAKRAEEKAAKLEAKKADKKKDESAASMKMIRAAKAKATQLRESGVASSVAGRIAASAVDRSKKRGPKRELFSGDGNKRPGKLPRTVDLSSIVGDDGGAPSSRPKVYAGGGRSKQVRAPKEGLTAKEKKRITNKGKGNASFKSKARHKRK